MRTSPLARTARPGYELAFLVAMKELGYKRFVLNSENEPAILKRKGDAAQG